VGTPFARKGPGNRALVLSGSARVIAGAVRSSARSRPSGTSWRHAHLHATAEREMHARRPAGKPCGGSPALRPTPLSTPVHPSVSLRCIRAELRAAPRSLAGTPRARRSCRVFPTATRSTDRLRDDPRARMLSGRPVGPV